jgi:hypothetical protein
MPKIPRKKKPAQPGDKIQTTIYITPEQRVWLAYQSATEGRSVSEIINSLLVFYHKKCTAANPATPPLDTQSGQ